MDKDKLKDCMQQAYYADDFMDLKEAMIQQIADGKRIQL